ncbi:MAG: S24/S26 family peptidase [Myxococcota bacterium]|nr:S24/S26 family peptidase [Myxococcota bacterium]
MTGGGFAGLASEALERFGAFHFKARGHSMRPVIPDGSIVTLKALYRPVRAGDLVAINIESRVVVHRILTAEGDTVQTGGDNNLSPDSVRPQRDLIGMVTRVEWPNGWQMRTDVFASRHLGRLVAWGLRRKWHIA